MKPIFWLSFSRCSLSSTATLTVHSSLAAVGFLAVVTGALADAGISVNAFSAYYHDHLLVPWAEGRRALSVLGRLREERP